MIILALLTGKPRHGSKAEFIAVRDEVRAALYAKLDASKEERKRVIAILKRAVDEIRAKKA